MVSRSLLAITISLCSAVALFPSSPAAANTPLKQATVQNLRNRVEIFLKKQQPRSAQKTDVMTPGDALQTYRSAMAELRFNDRSLARVGEQAIFQFTPNSRTLDLKKGTVLLFITPKQGTTRVRTPNAAAGIRGSALFVRYNEDNGVTTLGALTNSNIEICNDDKSQCVELKAGDMGYVHNNKVGVYKFDLKTFQETSPLFKDVDLDQVSEVKEEIQQALREQGTFAGTYESTPAWLKLATNLAAPTASSATTPGPSGSPSLLDRPDVISFPAGTIPGGAVVAGPPTSTSSPTPTSVILPTTTVRPPPETGRPLPQSIPQPPAQVNLPNSLPSPSTPPTLPAPAPSTPGSQPVVTTPGVTPQAGIPATIDTPVVSQPATPATPANPATGTPATPARPATP